ncbi:unnamed protein product [Paramecium octaurelia]|uniref:Uncharacterized protein n=1 Tax=Paramecium octaurelia TaxID=43137 RepID=A0A8S1W561_PAROT|nr:unnamed protein product [Paramecium octaurelia]
MSDIRILDLIRVNSYSEFQVEYDALLPPNIIHFDDQNQSPIYVDSINIEDVGKDLSTNIVSNPSPPICKQIQKPQCFNSTNQRLEKYQSKQRKQFNAHPGESKNIPKNFTRALKNFIINHFDSSVQKNPEIKKFLATRSAKACKQTLENALHSCKLLNQISLVFFGNLKWGTIFLEQNKVDLETYIRFNEVWFESIN